MTKKTVLIEVVAGVEGPSCYVANNEGGHRISGPKPWGGGKVIHSFEVDLGELVREAKAHAFIADKIDPLTQGTGGP